MAHALDVLRLTRGVYACPLLLLFLSIFFFVSFCFLQALGSVVTAYYSDSAALLLSNGMAISMGLSGGLLYVSHWIGGKFDLYTATGYVVGEDDSATAVQGL
jgi:hypothetical protein